MIKDNPRFTDDDFKDALNAIIIVHQLVKSGYLGILNEPFNRRYLFKLIWRFFKVCKGNLSPIMDWKGVFASRALSYQKIGDGIFVLRAMRPNSCITRTMFAYSEDNRAEFALRTMNKEVIVTTVISYLLASRLDRSEVYKFLGVDFCKCMVT